MSFLHLGVGHEPDGRGSYRQDSRQGHGMTAVPVVAGIDTGTSGCKVTVLANSGAILATAFRSYPTYHEHPGWAEQDPADWVRAAHSNLTEALDLARGTAAGPVELRALSFSAPHHVAVLCDTAMKPIRRAIMWTDQRSAGIARATASSHGDLIWRRCGNVPAATWTLPQMQWLRQHEPQVLQSTQRILFMKDFVRHSFCPAHVTDHVDAAGSLLYDPGTRTWVGELLELAGLEESVMPHVVQAQDCVGNLDQTVANSVETSVGVAVLAGSADTAAELLAAGCVTPGDYSLKLATAGNVSHVETTPSAGTETISYPYLVPGTYYLNSATNSAAASFEWLARIFAGATSVSRDFFQRLDQEAAQVPPGSEGLAFHPYLNGERAPHWNPALRASFVGLTSAHERGHMARAVMEGVAMSMREARGPQAPPLSAATLIGGGARSGVWAGIMAAVFKTELRVPEVADSSLGGALLAATHLGWLTDISHAPAFLGDNSAVYAADARSADVYDHAFTRYQRIQQALQPGYDTDYHQ